MPIKSIVPKVAQVIGVFFVILEVSLLNDDDDDDDTWKEAMREMEDLGPVAFLQ